MRIILKSIITLSTVLMFVFFPVLVHAQEPGCDPLCNCRADNSICPIDNEVWLLLGFGVLYGIKKIRNAHKKEIPIR